MQILRAANINPAVLREPETLIPYTAVADALQLASQSCQTSSFGIRLGLTQGLSTLGALGLISAQQPTMIEAMNLARKYVHLHAHGADVQLINERDYLLIALTIDLPQAETIDQLLQLSIGLIYRVIQSMCGNGWQAQSLLFRQPKPNAMADLQLDCPIRFEQQYNGLLIKPSDMSIKPKIDESLIQEHFQIYLHQLNEKYPNQLSAKIKHTIKNLLPLGECNLQNVALTLGISPRVLQKRLKQNESSFTHLLKETRLEIACDLISDESYSLTEIALRLGFAELPVFTRSFKAWTGYSPKQWKKQKQLEGLAGAFEQKLTVSNCF